MSASGPRGAPEFNDAPAAIAIAIWIDGQKLTDTMNGERSIS
jgi:hypothetical protein